MKHFVTAICAISLFGSSAFALEINTKPGELANRYAEIRNTQDALLKLTGAADVRDLALLKNISPTISTIDMSGLSLKAYTYPSGDYMGKVTFADDELPPYVLSGSQVVSVKLPSTLKTVGESAFVASQIENIDFPITVTKIGDYAFANCERLISAVFYSNLQIGTGVFKDCKALRRVQLHSDISEIPEAMFDGCIVFSQEMPTSVKKVGPFAYRGTAGETVNLSNTDSVGDYAFADMKNLNAIVTATNRGLQLGKGVFFNDDALETLPTFDTDMSNAVFAQSSGITTTTINSANIGEGAYANNLRLDSIYLGPNVRYIGSNAFRNDKALTLIDVSSLGKNIPEVEADAFSGLLNEEGKYDIDLNVQNSTESEWAQHEVWGRFNIGNFQVGIDDVINDGFAEIRVVRSGNTVNVESSSSLDYVGVFTIGGIVLFETTPQTDTFTVTDLPTDEIIVVKVISGGSVKIVKLK